MWGREKALALAGIFCNFIGLLPHTLMCIKPYIRIYIEKKLRVKTPSYNASLPLHYVIFSEQFDVSAILKKYFAYVVITLICSKPRYVAWKPATAKAFSLPPKGPGKEIVAHIFYCFWKHYI